MPHPLKTLIDTADRAITAEDFDSVTEFCAEDATLVVRPGLIRRAFEAIAAHFGHSLKISQGEMVVLEGADTALVLMEWKLDALDKAGAEVAIVRRSTYVFRRGDDGRWLCAIDNSYGTDLLSAG